MDIDVFPNTLEYWGPTAMVFFRNAQVRYMPIQGDSRLTFALERPGASADRGDFDDHLDLANVVGRFPLAGSLGPRAALGAQMGLRPARRNSCAASTGTISFATTRSTSAGT